MARQPLILLFAVTIPYSLFIICSAVDTLSTSQILRDGETILSAGGRFELGFFSPDNLTKNRYLGVWYKQKSEGTVVWVANRDSPLTNNSGVLQLAGDGTLSIVGGSGNDAVWSANPSKPGNTPVAKLLDTGNFVVTDGNSGGTGNTLWQSFDYPGNTILPGMKFGKNLVTGMEWNMTSWKSVTDPSVGDFSASIDASGFPQYFIKRGPVVQTRPGPWNGLRFSGEPNLEPNSLYTFDFIINQNEIYYMYQLSDDSVLMRNVIDSSGTVNLFLWIDRTQQWTTYLSPQTDTCDRYKLCGAYGYCDINNSPACGCFPWFEPSSPEQWNVADWTQGCKRNITLDCANDEGFRMYQGLKLPDTSQAWYNESMDLFECERKCKSNCSCMAYTNSNISGSGSGCLLWFGDLFDIRDYTSNGQGLYIRMAAAALSTDRRAATGARARNAIISVLSILVGILLGLLIVFVFRRRRRRRRRMTMRMRGEGLQLQNPREAYSRESQGGDFELPYFEVSTLIKATNNFSVNNKVGEGGFGPVYKGKLEGGQEIAVKRLAQSSTQGLDEFKNEVICISKLQHRNLVKLLGCCIHGKETMLVYEYMPNKGLDAFIFDETQRKLLNWPMRFRIINGVARGLLYLHQDSRLRIIHRDLKASNILLDFDMNPKISDFGMARSFGGNETEANTRKVVGTYGYMSPEYAGHGIFSVKSDVFSFGVLVLEMVSGRKNRGFFHPKHSHNLLGHAWELHKEGRTLELIDPYISDSCYLYEVMRSIHIGLLCVQQNPEDRPGMPTVVLMLSSDRELQQPKHPGFYAEKTMLGPETSCSSYPMSSTNEVTITLIEEEREKGAVRNQR